MPVEAPTDGAWSSLLWRPLEINHLDPVEVSLSSRLRESAVNHIAGSSSAQYVLCWNKFTAWCRERREPRCPLPASEVTVALYLQYVADSATSFSAVKSASAAIAYFQRINLYSHEPTMGQLASFVRNAAMRRLGLAPRARKAPFTWDDILRFARQRLTSDDPPYCYLVVVTLCAVSFGGMCRFSDAASLRISSVVFAADFKSVTLSFVKRKNDQYRQGSKVTVSSSGDNCCCPVALLQRLCTWTRSSSSDLLFQGFDGSLVRRFPERSTPIGSAIAYPQFRRYLSQWFAPVLGLSPGAFLKEFGSQSGRSGGASAAANAGVPWERWGQHGSWQSVSAQRAYMQLSDENILGVSQTIMTPRPEDRQVSDESSEEVDGVDNPHNPFVWHE